MLQVSLILLNCFANLALTVFYIVGRQPIPYDLLWPVKKPPGSVVGKVVEVQKDNTYLGSSKSNGSITGLGLGPIQCKQHLPWPSRLILISDHF